MPQRRFASPVGPARPSLAARRRALALLPLLLAACAGSPPVQLYRLPTEPPVTPPPPQRGEPWQLLLPVRLPDYLDREALLLPQGGSGVLALSGHRWAESLRDAVPRVLQADLLALTGPGSVWTAPLPPGAAPTRQLRVEILALEAEADRSGVRLQARWTWSDVQGRSVPRAEGATLRVPAQGGSIDRLVDAHRLGLWRLAERIAASR